MYRQHHDDVSENHIDRMGGHFHIEARISGDNINWRGAHINSLSSRGLHLLTDKPYEKGDLIYFDLVVHGFFSEFEVRVSGVVRQAHEKEGHCVYTVIFLNLSPDLQIRIDENIKRDRPLGGGLYG